MQDLPNESNPEAQSPQEKKKYPKQKKGPGHGDLCSCARCKRTNEFKARKKIEHDALIKKYLEELPKDRILFILADETIESMQKKLPELRDKFSFNPDFTAEDYTRFLNELANTSIINYLQTL